MTSPAERPIHIYKVASAELVREAQDRGVFTGMPVDAADGYIHFSTAEQLGETLRRHFAGQSGLVLFSVRLADLGQAVRWEPSRGGQLFPHLYGPLPMTAVVRSAPIAMDESGAVALPDWVE